VDIEDLPLVARFTTYSVGFASRSLSHMLEPIPTLRDRAEFYHRQLPDTMRRRLNERGIPDTFVEKYFLGWNGQAITIPVANREGDMVFLKLVKSPFARSGAPKMEAPPYATVQLYGWDTLLRQPGRVVIAGDEFDRVDFDLGSPPQTLILASSSGHNEYCLNFGFAYEPSEIYATRVRADLAYYETAGGGAVFSVGSMCWCASLSHNAYANNVATITKNVLDEFLRRGLNPA